MLFEMTLQTNNFLPVYRCNIGYSLNSELNICIDTGSAITIFYMSVERAKLYFPNMKLISNAFETRNADGSKTLSDLYIIPEFILTDDNNKKLIIENLYCLFSKGRIKGINILLSGEIFLNTKMTISFVKKDDKPRRMWYIDTFGKDKNILQMKMHQDLEGKLVGFPAFYKGTKV